MKVMLATLVDEPFDDRNWVFETKWDGFRTLAKKGVGVQLLSRGTKSYTEHFPSIVQELERLRARCFLDGEMVILDRQGRSKFQLLQNYQRTRKGTPYYYVFDILSLNGKNLRSKPLLERKKILHTLLKTASMPHVKYSDHVAGKGKAFFKKALHKGLEGMIAKRGESHYLLRRSREWLKVKTTLRQEVVIGGFTQPRRSRSYLGALLVGVYEGGKLRYVGHVGGGFSRSSLKEAYEELAPLRTARCPFFNEPHPNEKVAWIRPVKVCEVAFAEWTDDGILRQPVFKGMRSDKPPKKVVREKPKRVAKK